LPKHRPSLRRMAVSVALDALAVRLLNGRSSQAGAGESRCWDCSHITGTHNRTLGRACTQLRAAAGAQTAVSPDLRTLTCGSFELRRNAETSWQMEEH
jgi:hypothetical protein